MPLLTILARYCVPTKNLLFDQENPVLFEPSDLTCFVGKSIQMKYYLFLLSFLLKSSDNEPYHGYTSTYRPSLNKVCLSLVANSNGLYYKNNLKIMHFRNGSIDRPLP